MSRAIANIFFCSFEVLARNRHNILQMTGLHGLNQKRISKHIIISRHKISPEAAKPVKVKSLKNKIFEVFLVSFKMYFEYVVCLFIVTALPHHQRRDLFSFGFFVPYV